MNTKINYRYYLKKAFLFMLALTGLLLLMTSGPAYKLGLFILFSLAGLYVYARLKNLLPASRPVRRIFSLVFLLLVLAYPLIELLAHGDQAGSLKTVLLFGYYSLPFLLYVFLLTVLGDLLLALNRRLKTVPLAFIRNRKFAAGALAILLAERQEAMKQSFKVQIFATDIDGQAIATARRCTLSTIRAR